VSTARYAALLSVILIIGLAGVAHATDGQPLIIGAHNTSESNETWLDGTLNVLGLSAEAVRTSAVETSSLVCDEPLSGYGLACGSIPISAGATKKTVQIGSLKIDPSGEVSKAGVMLQVMGNRPDVRATALITTGGTLTIFLNEPAPANMRVAYIVFGITGD
jgi:hypothetical protein